MINNLKVDTRALEKKIKRTKREMERAEVSAVNDTTKQLRTDASKEIRSSLRAKKKDVDRRLRITRAKPSNPTGSLTIRSRPLSLGAFKPRQTKAGVSVRIRKGQGVKKYPGAFGPKIPRLGGGVWKRVGKSRLPIRRLPGVNLAAEAEAVGAVERAKRLAKPKLAKNYERRLKLARMRGRV